MKHIKQLLLLYIFMLKLMIINTSSMKIELKLSIMKYQMPLFKVKGPQQSFRISIRFRKHGRSM